MSTRKAWSRIVEEAGVRVRLYRGAKGHIYRAIVTGRTVSKNGKRRPVEDRRSLGHSDRDRAIVEAKELAKYLAVGRLTGMTLERLTLGRLLAAYAMHRVPGLKPPRAREAKARMAMFIEAWGADLDVADVDQSRVEIYCRMRRDLRIVSPGLKPDEEGKLRRGFRTPRPPRDGALHGELSWLSTVFNWARGFRVSGRRLMSENPLHGVEWPKERNPRRPIATHSRYTATLKQADRVDPNGRLACILALARYTGRREAATCALRASDVLLSGDRIQAALAAAGMDEHLAQHAPHGALRWAAENDKQGFLFISPISKPAREALESYLRRNPRVGDVPLFPGPRAVGSPIRRECVGKWLARAEELAELPKLSGGSFHPFRRLWATERKGLADADVAAAGGWRDTRALRNSYQQADPATVLRVVEHSA